MPFDPIVLEASIDGPDPCGPDLEAAGDADYLNFMAEAEGMMPSSFFSFDASAFPSAELLDKASGFLARTRDVRLLVLVARILILSRDLKGFTATVVALRTVLDAHWDDVHPRAEDGDHSFRIAPLYNFDDPATVVFPLQWAPLLEAGRGGAATFRHQQLATGAAKAREGESFDALAFDRIQQECSLESLLAVRDLVRKLAAAIARIQAIVIEKAGYEYQIGLKRLPPVVEAMAAFLSEAAIRRDPSQDSEAPSADAAPEAGTGDAPAPAVSFGAIGSQAAAGAALDAVIDYYTRREPSSPALPLVRQARESLGKTLYEVIAMLVPAHADAARIHVGAEPAFLVPLKGTVPPTGARVGEGDALPPLSSRGEAIQLLEQVSVYYRQAEPSSPVPLLIERARALSSRDFLALLKDLLPEAALKTMKIT